MTEDISPWALLDLVDQVYVVTSQLGFEALLAGKQVHCFGVPFFMPLIWITAVISTLIPGSVVGSNRRLP